MASMITVPVDARLIALRVTTYRIVEKKIQVGAKTQIQHERVQEVREVKPDPGKAEVEQAIAAANKIWKQADIAFNLRTCVAIATDPPGNSEEVNTAGFFAIVAKEKIKAMGGVVVLFVKKFESRDLGGFAAEAIGACIVTSLSASMLGNVLAHELGHLLSLPDIRHKEGSVAPNANLMYEAIPMDYKLDASQIEKARASARVRLAYQ